MSRPFGIRIAVSFRPDDPNPPQDPRPKNLLKTVTSQNLKTQDPRLKTRRLRPMITTALYRLMLAQTDADPAADDDAAASEEAINPEVTDDLDPPSVRFPTDLTDLDQWKDYLRWARAPALASLGGRALGIPRFCSFLAWIIAGWLSRMVQARACLPRTSTRPSRGSSPSWCDGR